MYCRRKNINEKGVELGRTVREREQQRNSRLSAHHWPWTVLCVYLLALQPSQWLSEGLQPSFFFLSGWFLLVVSLYPSLPLGSLPESAEPGLPSAPALALPLSPWILALQVLLCPLEPEHRATWELCENCNAWALPSPAESEALGVGPGSRAFCKGAGWFWWTVRMTTILSLVRPICKQGLGLPAYFCVTST